MVMIMEHHDWQLEPEAVPAIQQHTSDKLKFEVSTEMK
jgi:hypothetical protein